MRFRLVLALVFLSALALAPGAIASPFDVGARVVPHDVSPGSTSLDKNGCPVFIQVPYAPVQELSAGPGEHCVSLPTSLVAQTVTSDGRCVQNEWVQIRIPKNVVDYAAVWYSSVGLGTRWWSGGATLGPASVPGEGFSYPVPPGYGAWSAAGGAGPAGSCAVPAGTYGVAGWGVTGQHKISGTLTVAGTRDPVPDISVNASCPGGGNTTTDENGNYAFLVDANTTCTVAPRLTRGKATPTQRVVHVYRSDVNHVDFSLPCDAGSAITGHIATALATTASRPRGCPLKVFVRVVGPLANVGTRSGLARDDALPAEGPINLSTLASSKSWNNFVEPNEEGQKCESGCANLLVTVIDSKTKQPVQGALVTTKLGSIDTQAEAKLQQGHQFLCIQSETPVIPQCGTTIGPQITDQKGQVHLLYWAPGEFEKAHTKVTADADCSTSGCQSACGCTVSNRKGSGHTKLTVVPDKIWENADGELSPKETRILMTIAESPTGLVELLNAATERYMLYKLSALAAAELISEHLIDAIESPYGYAASEVVQIYNSWSDYQEELAQDAAFLSGIKLSAVGLYDPPFEKNIPLAPASDLTIQLLDVGAAAVGNGGLLYTLGKELDQQAHDLHEKPIRPPKERIRVTAYEVSNCNEANPVCGPGYSLSSGIQPELLFHFEFSNDRPGGDFHKTLLITFYDPVAWMLSQKIPKGLP